MKHMFVYNWKCGVRLGGFIYYNTPINVDAGSKGWDGRWFGPAAHPIRLQLNIHHVF